MGQFFRSRTHAPQYLQRSEKNGNNSQLAQVMGSCFLQEGALNVEYEQKYWKIILAKAVTPKIRKLTLYCCSIKDEQISNITERKWPELKDLDLRLNQIGDEGIKQMLKISWPKLETISFFQNSITDAGLILMTKNCHKLKNLQKLDIGANLIKKQGIRQFPNYPLLENLSYLNLHYCQIGSSGAKTLVKTKMTKLQTLRISGCRLGNEGIKHLTKIEGKLINIDIYENYVGVDGHRTFANLNEWNLQVLFVSFHQNQVVDPICVLPYARYSSADKHFMYNIQNQEMKTKIGQLFQSNSL